MILTPHTIIGAAIANIFPSNPEIGFVLAFFSHYAMDAIPHNHYKHDSLILKKTESIASIFHNIKAFLQLTLILADFFVGTFIAILIFSRDWNSLFITLLGVLGGVLPDFFQFLYFKFKKEPFISLQKFHGKFEHNPNLDDRPVTGTLIQVLTVMLFVFLSLWVSM